MHPHYSLAVRRIALRAMEAAHARWMSCPKWSPAHLHIKIRKDHALSVWARANRRHA